MMAFMMHDGLAHMDRLGCSVFNPRRYGSCIEFCLENRLQNDFETPPDVDDSWKLACGTVLGLSTDQVWGSEHRRKYIITQYEVSALGIHSTCPGSCLPQRFKPCCLLWSATTLLFHHLDHSSDWCCESFGSYSMCTSVYKSITAWSCI